MENHEIKLHQSSLSDVLRIINININFDKVVKFINFFFIVPNLMKNRQNLETDMRRQRN